MPTSNNKEENTVQAMVITSQKIIELMGKDLSTHFSHYKVMLINITPATAYGPDAMTLVLEGKHSDIKKSLKHLKKACLAKESGVEFSSIRSLPPAMKGYLSDMEDKSRFEKIFSYCSKEYLEYCKSNKMSPHPEVLEAFKKEI